MRIKFNEHHWSTFVRSLLARRDVETAGIALCRVHETATGPLLVGDELRVLDDDAYVIREPDRLRIDPVAMSRMTQRARDDGLSIFTVHTHPLSTDPWFSWADDVGDSRLMPALHAQAPGRPHGSIVVTGSAVALARAFDASGKARFIPLDVVGARLRRFAERSGTDDDRFHRQDLALGAEAREALGQLRVGVVGVGGTGSIVAAQLVHHGVGEIVAMDSDVVDATNLPRILGSGLADVGETAKVAVADRYARGTGMPAKVTCCARQLTGEAELSLLRTCDVVFSCVDRHAPRALLNRMSYECAVPVIDIGVAFRVHAGSVTSCGGRVVVVGPGRPCLACWGHIDPERLRIEALDEASRAAEAQLGYVDGADVPAPSVMAFNVAASGMAVIEFLRLVTGFAGADSPPNRLGFQFASGEVVRNTVAARTGCPYCGRSMSS